MSLSWGLENGKKNSTSYFRSRDSRDNWVSTLLKTNKKVLAIVCPNTMIWVFHYLSRSKSLQSSPVSLETKSNLHKILLSPLNAYTRALSAGNSLYYISLHSGKILTEWSHELHWAAPGAGLFLGAWATLQGALAPRLPPLDPLGEWTRISLKGWRRNMLLGLFFW